MVIPNTPVPVGATFTGRATWFGAPSVDSGNNSTTATGTPSSGPGLAFFNRSTLGGYWRLTDTTTGRTIIERQTDLGPNAYTGNTFDIQQGSVSKFGYTLANFPNPTIRGTYLGKNPSNASMLGATSLPSTTSSSGSSSSTPTSTSFAHDLLRGLLFVALAGAGVVIAGLGIRAVLAPTSPTPTPTPTRATA